MASKYKNNLDIYNTPEGLERQAEFWGEPLKGGSFLPSPVTYKDIDSEFDKWVDKGLPIKDANGNLFPTFVLYSNQRFSEYTQSWFKTDDNNNMLLNFKTITRENNPSYGKIQGGLWNIPGRERFFTMKKDVVLDDNGTESLRVLKMRQPTAIDLSYKITIFTSQYSQINEFNMLINRLFNARQYYLVPNGYYMPMILDSISDESAYQIDDRQFYGQTYNITVQGYILEEDDFRIYEVPLKRGLTIPMAPDKRNLPMAEIEECDDGNKVILTITYPEKTTKTVTHFTNDMDFTIKEVKRENLYNKVKFYVNGDMKDLNTSIELHSGDDMSVWVSRMDKTKVSYLEIIGEKLLK